MANQSQTAPMPQHTIQPIPAGSDSGYTFTPDETFGESLPAPKVISGTNKGNRLLGR